MFAHERKADSIEHAQQLSTTRYFWWVTYLADYSNWDWLYEPKPWQSHQRHAWPSQHQPDSGLYLVPTAGFSDTNYHDDCKIQILSSTENWVCHEEIGAWDWSWHPNPLDPPYIYVFGNQWNAPECKASVEYRVPGATEVKYMDLRTQRLPQKHLFSTKIAVGEFDYSWEPNPFDPPYIYVFGNTWYSAEIEPSVEYRVLGATEVKYVHDIVSRPWGSMANYEFLHDIELDQFDWTWHPNPNDPPYIYVFGNQWYSAEIMPTLKYHHPGATELKYMDHPRATLVERHDNCWHTIEDCEWDYSWVPDPGDPPYKYVFGNQWHSAEIMPTVTYTVPGATEHKYVDYPRARLLASTEGWNNLSKHQYEFDYSWVPDPGDPLMVYVFGNQHWPAEVMPMLRYCAIGVDESSPVKYIDYPTATLLPNRTLWTVPVNIKEEQVDYTWVPDPGEPPYIYQFATQHQKTGGPVYTVPGATEVKYLEHVQVEIKTTTVPIVEIDHLDGHAGLIPNTVKRIRYFDNYRDTLIRLAKSLVGEHEHVWVCSSICDYTDFDFSWHPEKWQGTMLHVFPSDTQKFGDTFYMHVPTFAERAEKKQLLEWYSVNYVSRRKVPRRPMPVIVHDADSHVDAVKSQDFVGPLATFTNHDYVPSNLVTVPLWRQETKTIVPISSGAGSVVVPKVAVPFVKTQLYDYPHIDKTQRMLKDKPLDIVFISNGEPNADQHWQDLVYALQRGQNNRAVRVDGVNGRVAAYHAAANASYTPWFFAVFAKLKVNADFDWEWQPDRMQQPKHYIFHARNPINGLEYGHQAMIAYNKQLVLANTGQGLDFTLDQPHEVVPILSGTAWYADSPWMAWRTAFREVIKLKASLPDVESEYRLNKWLTRGVGSGEWSTNGAEDAVEFYDAVGGDFAELRKSYDWAWLASYAFMRRNLTTDQ